MSQPVGFWEKFLGLFLHNRFVVWVLLGVLLTAGLMVAPVNLTGDALPRDPVPVDAIPDIGENQQIVFTRWPGRSPRDVEDQVSYPLTTALLGIPGVRTVRSFSMMGFSTIYVIFEEGVDFYWSRSRVLEKLSSLPAGLMPPDVAPALGPDATALGQVYWYTLEGRDPETGQVVGGWSLHELRSIQDWTVRYALQGVPGVSEVASVGGHVQEYQVDVDPEAMRAHGVSLEEIARAVGGSNMDVGARTVEINRVEYVVRGLGLLKDLEDLEQVVVASRDHVPIRVRDVARVGLGPAARRGALDKAGAEAVGGVVVARFGENPLEVIDRVKARIQEVSGGLPEKTLEDGRTSRVTVVPFYDRSTLIQETLGTLSTALWQQILITVIVVLLLLRRLRSSLLVSSILPMAVLTTFLAMKLAGVDANIMSLAGIAVAIGTMVDMGIVLTENMVARLEDPGTQSRSQALRAAAAEVAPAVLTSVATTVVGFLPVFALTASEGRLFRPLAYTKTFALLSSVLLALTVLPGLAHVLLWPRVKALAPGSSRWAVVWRSALRLAHLRDWVLVVLGVSLAATVHLWAGLFVVLVGVLRFVEPHLPERLRQAPAWLESGLAVVAMIWLLTQSWMPLGLGESFGSNLLLVCGLVGGLMAVFLLFLRGYERILAWALENKLLFLSGPVVLVLVGLTIWLGFGRVFGWLPDSVRLHPTAVQAAHAMPGLGREFMPPFDEGSYLYMPTTMPHASVGEALELLQTLDASIKTIPEVEDVVGKLGRVDSALDPAPVSMFETVVTYKPEWRVEADGTRVRQWRDHIKGPADIWREIARMARLPGLTSAPELMPINTRIVMLQTGMRAPMGLKVRGPDLETLERVGQELEGWLKQVPALRGETVFAERVVGKPYLEVEIDREAIGRFGLSVEQVQRTLQVGLGGVPLTRTIEGRQRYPVRVRYMREERDSVEALRRVPVMTPSGQPVPLEQLARLSYVRGPQVIKAEDTFLTSSVIFDKQPGVAEADAVERARAFLELKRASGELVLPEGVSYTFTGTYENQLRGEQRLKVLVPLALALIFVLLYLQFRRVSTTLMIYSGVAVSVSGGFLLLWLYQQPWFLDVEVMGHSARALFQVGPVNLSVAVWVGFIALVGIATDDGVVMATYLKQHFSDHEPTSIEEIRRHIRDAGKRRVRPCLMTTATTVLALLPVVTSQGRGADVMVPMALPSLGGMGVELMTLFVVPVLYGAREELRWRWRRWRAQRDPAQSASL
jgi:Cu(I)/Ag(I) efflux system membrane protein CusA/SilA